MAGYDSKYSGAQVEALLDQVASGNAGGGGGGGIAVETDPIFSASPAASITEAKKTEWDNKMDKVALATVATSGNYNDLSNKPTIPSAVTESTVSGWGFTKNTGTYSKPSGGIPKTDLASSVQTSLGKADTALQSYTEQYKGTVTGVKMNGSTKSPSGGVVDLGTVITSHQDISGKQDELVSGINIKTINGTSILGSGNITIEGGSGGGSTSIKPYVLQAVALSELEALGVGEHTLYSRDYQKAGEDLTALQDAAIGDGLVALVYPYDESAMGYIFPTSVRIGMEEYGAEVQFYINGATFTLYYPTAPSEDYSDINVSVLRQGEKEVVRVDNGGGITNDIYDMRPNVIYAPVLCSSVAIHNFLPAQVSEKRSCAYDVFSAILDLENSISVEDPPELTIVDNINWVNGEFPELTEGLWELSIARFTEWMGEDLDPYTEYFGVLTPFKYEE